MRFDPSVVLPRLEHTVEQGCWCILLHFWIFCDAWSGGRPSDACFCGKTLTGKSSRIWRASIWLWSPMVCLLFVSD